MTYFRGKCNPLSSARRRFTVLFGMGRSGSTLLWSSGKDGDCWLKAGPWVSNRNLEEARRLRISTTV